MNHKDTTSDDQQPNRAADLIRQKIEGLYATEPNAQQEIVEAQIAEPPLSKHQQFMRELSQSGKSPDDIQAAWHTYYLNLPDEEKHAVWQEFYAESAQTKAAPEPKSAIQVHPPQQSAPHHVEKPKETHALSAKPKARPPKTIEPIRSVATIKRQLLGKIQAKERHRRARASHIHSIIFGLGMGSIVVVILLFSFFNERLIAPFITPSRTVSNTPIITSPDDTAVGPEPKVIIPKINVEIPVVYDEPSIEEAAVQKALERGVLHYATTPEPGQQGNSVIFGHSSNNILNPGKYKFAFVLLSRLEVGDTFMLQKDSKRYVYRIYDKEIVSPSNVSVLTNTNKPATATLITCDPPGTSINRLVVIGEQISPDPGTNVASTVNPQTTSKPQVLPSNAPSLWERITGWFRG